MPLKQGIQMLDRLFGRKAGADGAPKPRRGHDLSTPWARLLTRLNFVLVDHAFLRVWWTNLHEVAPGVWRSNQPGMARLRRLKAEGFATIISLRGDPRTSDALLESDECKRLGLTFETIALSARRAFPADTYLKAIDLIRDAEKPVLFHCKSGADRTGIIAAFYLIDVMAAPVEEARKHLHWRYFHLNNAHTGILDDILDRFDAAHQASGVTLRDWLATEYDHTVANDDFVRIRRKGRGQV